MMQQPPDKARPQRNPADYGYPTPDILALREKALEVTMRLTQYYGVADWSTKDPLGMLVDILLSHRTRDEQTAAAYQALLDRFGSWKGVRDAPLDQVESTIANVTWPEQKAPRIQAILRQITEEHGELNLEFLRTMPLVESMAWLSRLEGVGPKTTACVLLFSLQQPTLPVDTHVHRVSIRLGLIGKKVSADNAHRLLQALLPDDARIIYNFHKGLLRHGQRVCIYGKPRCNRCVLTDLCHYYRTVIQP